jgi:hypothetical protein
MGMKEGAKSGALGAAAAFSVPFAKCMDMSRQNLRVLNRTPTEDKARW